MRPDLSWYVDHLLQDGRISAGDAQALRSLAGGAETGVQLHPLEKIARCQLHEPAGPLLDLERLCLWLAQRSGLDFVQIDPIRIQAARVAAVMSQRFAESHEILALAIDDQQVLIGCAQPLHTRWMPDLQRTLGERRLQRVLVQPDQLRRYTREFYQLARSIDRAGTQLGPRNSGLGVEVDLGQSGNPDANGQHIVAIVDWLFQYAFEQGASDIHIEPRREIGRLRFRIDGVLHVMQELPMGVMTAVIARIKILGRLNIAEKRRPQDGRVKTRKPDGGEVELRLSTLPTAFGEKLVMRIFDPELSQQGFEEMGLLGAELQSWKQMCAHSSGIVLVTGPTGSGKTTTLYASLRQLASDEVNVSTLEDPIEMLEPRFNQMQVMQGIDLSFADGIRALLRQDPDIIMVGEIRDGETADMAIQAALTGHLVLSSLHTNDAPSSITRLLDIGVQPFLIAATLQGVMAQRLVRLLCPDCKQEGGVDPLAWNECTRPWKLPLPAQVYHARGCKLCRGTGYRGRTGIHEVLMVSPVLRRMISERADASRLRRQACREGMHTLRLNGALKVRSGLTTLEEVLRVAPGDW